MTRLRDLGPLKVHPLNLGGNVFGWSADESESIAVLDAYADAGGNFIDTADAYMIEGGESEAIIGRWMAGRANREDLVIATKVAKKKDRRGLSPDNLRTSLEESLRRLQADHVALYYAHEDDESVPLEESLGTFSSFVDDGRVRAYGLSNFTPERIGEALAVCDAQGLHRPVALQPHYNLVERAGFENGMRDAAQEGGLGVMPYFSLAMGFLTGKYREGGEKVDSQRAEGAGRYLRTAQGPKVLEALDEVAAAHDVTDAAVALAWLRNQPTVVAPIASARTTDQLAEILPMADLDLSDEEKDQLDRASRSGT